MAAHRDLSQRVIHWASLDTPIQRVIGFGFALLLGLAALTALRELFAGGEVFVVTYVVPLAALVIAGVAIGVAVALMLAGASAARSHWRFVGLAGLAGLCLALMPPPARSEAELTSAEIAWIAVYLLAAGGVALVAFGHRLGAWYRALALAALLVAVVALVVLAATVLPPAIYGAEVVVKLMMFIVFAALPAIIIVGWDLAEIAGEVSATAMRRLAAFFEKPGLADTLSIVLALTLATWLGAAHALSAGSVFYRAAALGMLCLLFAWALPRLQTSAPRDAPPVGYFHVLFVAAMIATTLWTDGAATRDADGVFNAHTGHEFSLELPAGWQVVRDPLLGIPAIAETRRGTTHVRLAPLGRPGIPRLVMRALPLTPETRLPRDSINVQVNPIEVVPVPLVLKKKEGLHTATARFNDSKGRTYALDFAHLVYDDRGPANGVYLVTCVYKLPDTAGVEKACEAIAGSFQLDLRTVPLTEPRLFFNEVIWVALALASLIVLLAWPTAGSSIEFLIWAAIVIAVRNAGTTLNHYHHEVAQEVTQSAEILAAALWLGAIGVFVANVEAGRTHTLRLAQARQTALSFLMTLIVAVVVFELYVQAAEASGHSHVVRGVIICLALSWEFWTSGAITNHDSTHYPRPARIMFYLGYLLAVATIVFFWVQIERAAGRPQAAFEAELYVAAGIACLGLPFLLFRHVRAYLDAVGPWAATSQPAASPSDP